MNISNVSSDSFRIVLPRSDFVGIGNSMFEARCELQIPDFEHAIGLNRSAVEALHDDLRATLRGQPAHSLDASRLPDGEYQMEVTRAQLAALGNCVRETRKRLDPREFHSRLGVDPHEVDAIIQTIDQALAR